jgi:hypothetical protein
MIKLLSLFKDVILEGGNVFGTTDRIKKEDIPPTLENFTEELGKIFPKKKGTFKFQTLGSVGQKAESGDIDLGYDGNNLVKDGKADLEGWNIDPEEFQQTFDRIRKRARSATEEQSTKRAMLELIAKQVIDAPGPIKADMKAAGNGSLFFEFPQYDEAGNELDKHVQIDINVGDLDWLKFSYFSKGYTGNIKGLHRTQLLVALFKNKDLTFNHNLGVKDKEGNILAKNPKQVLDLLNKLYGTNISEDIIYDYSELMKYLESNLSESDLHSIYDIYLKILDSTRADIPEHLQDYWIKNQERLGLKGKFLPDDSNLTKYKTV